jgi:hypothetical protein
LRCRQVTEFFRFINGLLGVAIAQALADAGADVAINRQFNAKISPRHLLGKIYAVA